MARHHDSDSRTRFTAALMIAWLSQLPLPAQNSGTGTIEQRLDRMEKELRALREENQQIKMENQELKRDLGVDGKTSGLLSVKPAGKEPMLKLGGLIQAQADFGDKGDSRFATRNDRFYMRRARLNAAGTFLENFEFRVELELAGTLGETSGLRAQGTDAYVQWSAYNEASIRVGQFKTPFGFEQLHRDPYLFGIERSLANDRLTLGRQLGAQVSGDFLEKRLSYAGGLFNGNGVNNGFNDNDNFMTAARLSAIPWQGKLFKQESSWGVGVNGYYSDDTSISGMNDFGFDSTPSSPAIDNVFAGVRKGLGSDTQVAVGPVELWAEYLRSWFEASNRFPSSRTEAEGWYAESAYYLIPKRLQALVKYETFDPNIDLDGNSTDTWTFGLNYFIKGHDLKLQLNYLLVDAPGYEHRQSKVLARVQAIF